MFTIYPDGKEGGGGGASSPFRTGLNFFGRMALYFGAVRAAYLFFGDRAERQRALAN